MSDQITRRGFLKKSALTGIAVAAAAVVAKVPEVTKAAPAAPPPIKVPDVDPEPAYGTFRTYAAIGSGSPYLYDD